jgi:ankyrin repeat protein
MTADRDPAEALAAAVHANAAADVARLLEQYPELKSTLDAPMRHGPFGATPLLGAVNNRNREMIDVLLSAGADINQRSHWWAGGFGVLDSDHDLATFLIERGATVDAHAAARLGMLDRLRELVAANPEVVHARGGDGQTPLHFASSVEIAEYLLDRGADIDARDIDHESTPVQWMIRDRQVVARYLVERGCSTDLLIGAALGDAGLVQRHLDANPSSVTTTVSERDFPKRDPRSGGCIYLWTLGLNKTPQIVAHEFGHENVFRWLMERTPDELKLAIAAKMGDEPLFRGLLDAHPGLVQSLSDGGRRKLVDEAQDENAPAVRLMLDGGWPIGARGQHGATALHWAAFHGNVAMVRDLLRHGAPIDLKDDDFDGPPLRWAIYGSVHGWRCRTGDYAGTVEALLDAGAKAPVLNDALEASGPVREVLALRRHI